jgi:superfamily II DNA or RNA helicase
MNSTLTDHQAKYFAHELQRSYANDQVGKLAGLLFDAQVEPKPHQIDAALFALQTPFLPGVILADEVGLGKTIEAGIVISQYWAERRRRILIIAPSPLRQQWQQELLEKFALPSAIIDPRSKDDLLAPGRAPQVLICSYEFAQRHEHSLLASWDLVVADEAHRLRNHWTGKTKSAAAVAHIVQNAHKTVLLTATPLQNRLEELYGLVSVFDPGYFTSLDAFRERYVKGGDDDLVERVAAISKRTLRRDADKYIRFTERLPLTVEFTPSEDEQTLYDLVNEYLQREHLYAFSGSQRHLAALIIRKRLGSSTYAVASTLQRIADRLADEAACGRPTQRSIAADFAVDDDLAGDVLEEAQEQRFGPSAAPAFDASDLAAMADEAAELREYAALARSITVNQKAVKLLEALDLGFARLRELGAADKAIIFTDSTKTQEYLARTLREAGRGEGLVLFNGSNDAPEQTEIYRRWLEAHRDSDLVTGIPAVDRRKALVDHFRTTNAPGGSIMIATEAAAEGINLQFCSMLVNYDLPWNPQRVEQRIGRVHRFGQKHNVVVVNLANKGNVAEARILELLADKFRLFSSVFGASDEVLGSIEDGFDFEKSIGDILTRCKTAAELEAAFDELEAQYATEISREMASAKAKVFDHLDPHVQDRLKAYDAEAGVVLNTFERLLLAVTRHELAEVATFEGDGRTFVLHKYPVTGVPTGRYFFKSQPLENAHQYRYAGPLAQDVIRRAKERETPSRELVFSLSASDRVPAALRGLVGATGTLTASEITFRMSARGEDVSESYMLAGALTDDGGWLDEEYVADLLGLACIEVRELAAAIDEAPFAERLESRRVELTQDVQGRNARHYAQQEELLYRSQQDRRPSTRAACASSGRRRRKRASSPAPRPTRWSSCASRRRPGAGSSARKTPTRSSASCVGSCAKKPTPTST